jgi:tetratricopeptide (TPR) repeat protein
MKIFCRRGVIHHALKWAQSIAPLQKTLTALLILLMTSCVTPQGLMMDQATHDEIRATQQLIKRGHYQEAIDELDTLLSFDAANPEALFLRGLAYQKSQKFHEAVQNYETLLKLNPQNLKAHYNLGMIFGFKTNQPHKALQRFDDFLSIKPDHPEARHVSQIMISLDQESYGLTDPRLQKLLAQDTPIKKLQEGLKTFPNSPTLLYQLGEAYQEAGRNKEAIKAFESALKFRPTCGPCHRALGQMFEIKEQAGLHSMKADLFGAQASPH